MAATKIPKPSPGWIRRCPDNIRVEFYQICSIIFHQGKLESGHTRSTVVRIWKVRKRRPGGQNRDLKKKFQRVVFPFVVLMWKKRTQKGSPEKNNFHLFREKILTFFCVDGSKNSPSPSTAGEKRAPAP